MVENLECLGHIFGHGQVDVTSFIVPFDVEAQVFTTCPIDGEGVFGRYSGKEMVSVGPIKIFNSEIIDCEGKVSAPSLVLPQSWGVGYR